MFGYLDENDPKRRAPPSYFQVRFFICRFQTDAIYIVVNYIQLFYSKYNHTVRLYILAIEKTFLNQYSMLFLVNINTSISLVLTHFIHF